MLKELFIVGLGVVAYKMYTNDKETAAQQEAEAQAEAEKKAAEQKQQQQQQMQKNLATLQSNSAARSLALTFASVAKHPNYKNLDQKNAWRNTTTLSKEDWPAFKKALEDMGAESYQSRYDYFKKYSGGKTGSAIGRGFNNKAYDGYRDALAERRNW